MHRWPIRSAIAVGLAGVLALLIAASDGGSFAFDRPDPDPTTATAAPSLFPPLAEDGPVRALQTGTNLVLPVTGGETGAWQVTTPCAEVAVANGNPLTGAHIVIDPGHGGTEIGAVGPTGLTEAELNLDIATRAARRLETEGATVVLTRTSDVRVTIQTRAELAVALEPLAFISIHHNAVRRGTAATPGSELYHQHASGESRRLAGLLWEEMQEELGPFLDEWAVGEQPGAFPRVSGDTGGDYYGVLRRTQGVPAVLSEAAYISNPAEEALLRTDEFRDAEAEAVSDAVLRYVTTQDPGSGFHPPRVIETPAGGGGGTADCEDPPLS